MSSGSGSTNTNTQVQQIPAFEQQASLNNQALAQSLGSQAYPTYQGDLIQGQTALQTQGQNQAVAASTAYQPGLNAAMQATGGALNPTGVNEGTAASASMLGRAQDLSATNPAAVSAYMSPYEQASLAPQLLAAQTQLGQTQQATNAQATQAGAFGDARQGAQNALNSYYGGQTMAGIEAQGMNSAYTQALQGINNQQTQDVNSANTLGNLASLQNTEQNTQINGANALAAQAGLQQADALTGANATYTAGQQQQTQGQTELNAAYQQYLNQVNWPYQMLNVQESALSNSPYNIATAVQLPNANTTAQGFGTAAGLAGLLGSGASGASGGASNVFGSGSDYRIKINIHPLDDATIRIKRLKPSRFNWKANPDGAVVDGFIAHEVAEVVPEAVQGEKDAVNEDGSIKIQRVDYALLVPLLTAGLQSALKRIDALERLILIEDNCL